MAFLRTQVLANILILGLIGVFTHSALATIEITDIDGASNFTGLASEKDDGNSPVIFGGTAGTACTNTDTTKTCSNCSASHGTNFNEACNDERIYNGLVLKVRFTSSDKSGTSAMTKSDGTGQLTRDGSSTGNLSSGSTHTIAVEWNNICTGLLSISSDCESDATATIAVGVDQNGDGDLDDTDDDKTTFTIQVQRTITALSSACSGAATNDGLCNFTVFPGDQKVFIKSLEAPTGFPNGSSIKYIQLRLYRTETGSFSDINHNSIFSIFDVEKEDDNDLATNTDAIDGLTNDQQYHFAMATVDTAKNVGFHSQVANLNTNDHAATPSPVSALLTEDLQCFIATAAFGHPFTKQVETLRKFRNEILMKTWVGRQLVDAYYLVSPTIADGIARRPWARKWTRTLLMPAVLLAQKTLQWGITQTLSIMLVVLGAFTATGWLLIRRRTVKTTL